jgi:hypothetical protein
MGCRRLGQRRKSNGLLRRVHRPAGLPLGPKDRREREGTRKCLFFLFSKPNQIKKSMVLISKPNTSIDHKICAVAWMHQQVSKPDILF